MIRRTTFPVAAALLLALSATSSPGAPAAPPGVRLIVQTDPIEASESMSHDVSFAIANPTGAGLYVDSMTCEIESLDPGETHASRKSVLSMPGASDLSPAISAGDTGRFQYVVRAGAEHARLTFRLHAHQIGSPPFLLTATAEGVPGPTSLLFPSRFLTSCGRRIEYVVVPAPDSGSAAPGLLLIHGHATHARQLLQRAISLSRRGYTVMAASMPGYGLSEGPPDFCGLATQQAMSVALDVLRRTPGVDSTRLAVWGTSRGAGVAADLAEQREDLRCAIAESGIYDLWAVYRGTKLPGFREGIVAEAGRDSAAWRARSPALAPEKVRAPLLFLHGERDSRVPVAQARGFYEALKARGLAAEAHFFPEAEHSLRGGEMDRVALDFLARQLKR